ncbi:MAG: cytochrome-c peroxidase [Flavobacteriales bacterium]|nr:cytochrome-c peroxidase [Flavobacteriales bacterium]
MNKFLIYIIGVSLFSIACKENIKKRETPYILDIPDAFPEMPIPSHNPLTVEKVELGRKLFFDPILSVDSTISCASCHIPQIAFADHEPQAKGIHGKIGMRNTPTLYNIGYAPYLFMEGKVPDLETQVIAPVQHEEEMGLNLRDLLKRLEKHPYYKKQFQLAFGEKPTPGNFVRALACFERTLISGNSSYDQYINGDTNALTAQQKLGMELFFSERLQCSKCHGGFNFTNYGFENIGLYVHYEDIGLARATADTNDIGKFKVPTLRNISITYPYMHNGSLQTLNDVIEFYNEGGKKNPNKSSLIKPLKLSEAEKKALISFLESLTEEQAYTKYLQP